MTADEATETVAPKHIHQGDVIADELGTRWVTVNQVQFVSDADGGVYSFYGEGPGDRVTFEGHEQVRRKLT